MKGRRVLVTGLGLVSPHGDDPERVFEALLQGRSAIGLWGRDELPPVVVARAPFAPEPWFTKLQLVGTDRVSQMAVAAAESARADAHWPDKLDPERVGIFIGSGMGGATALDDAYEALRLQRRMSPLSVVAGMTNAPAAHIAMRVGVHGPVYTYSVACASSALAIAEAAAIEDVDRQIRQHDDAAHRTGGEAVANQSGAPLGWQASPAQRNDQQ